MAKKKRAKKKSRRGPTVQLTMAPLDADKVKAIQQCLKGGQLKIEVSHVELGAGKVGDAWQYD